MTRDESSDLDERVGPEPADTKVTDTVVTDTVVTDSDPGGNGPHGLAGGMGVSSERTGHVQGSQRETTHGAVDPYPDLLADADPPPEKAAGGAEVHPDNTLPPHPFDRSKAQRHSHS